MRLICYFVLFIIKLTIITVETSASNSKIPSFIQKCRHHSDITECIENFLLSIKPKLKEGIPELDVPSLEPLDLGEINLKNNNNGRLNFTNLKVWGCSEYTIKNLMVDLHKHTFKYNLEFSYLHFEGNYDMDMQFLAFEMQDSGLMTGNLTNYQGNCIMHGKKVKRNKNEYLLFDKIEISIELGTSKIQLKSNAARNPLLNRVIDDLIVKNIDTLIEDMKPSLQETLSEKFLRTANIVTRNLPYYEMFPIK